MSLAVLLVAAKKREEVEGGERQEEEEEEEEVEEKRPRIGQLSQEAYVGKALLLVPTRRDATGS